MKVIRADGKIDSMDLAFLEVVRERTGEDIQKCYQCQKCYLGCPVAPFMDISPNQINRMIQYGLKDRILESSTIWLCSACATCVTRCPNGIDTARVMDVLKQLAIEEGGKIKERPIAAFHSIFLSNIKRYGRLHELSMLGKLRLAAGDLLKDWKLGIRLLRKGKFKFLPSKIREIDEVQQIFERSRSRN